MDYLQYLQEDNLLEVLNHQSFKPYYKWITFNTQQKIYKLSTKTTSVLNLIINGLPSIRFEDIDGEILFGF